MFLTILYYLWVGVLSAFTLIQFLIVLRAEKEEEYTKAIYEFLWLILFLITLTVTI